MGRGKIQIKRIEDKIKRQVTFAKRRMGLMKKTRELSVLCDVHVGLILFSDSGKLFQYCSQATSMQNLIMRYQVATGQRLPENNVHPDGLYEVEVGRIMRETENLGLSLQLYKGNDLNTLHYDDLLRFEHQLQNSLRRVRARKFELLLQEMDNLKRKQRIMEEENQQIYHLMKEQESSWEQQIEMQMTTYMKGEDDVMRRQVMEQFPFCGEEQPTSVLRLAAALPQPSQFQPYSRLVQPVQPNLQDFSLHLPGDNLRPEK